MAFPITSTLDATTYAIDGWPCAIAVVVLVLSLGVVRWGLGDLVRSNIAWAATVSVAALTAVVALLSLLKAANASVSFLLDERSAEWVARRFFVPLLLERSAMLLGPLVMLAGIALAIVRRKWIAVATIVLAAPAVPLFLHVSGVERILILPRAVVDGAPHMHLGTTRNVHVSLGYADGSRYNDKTLAAYPVTPVVGDRLGPKEFMIQTQNRWVTLETRVLLTVSEPRGNPLLPFRIGYVRRFTGEQRCVLEAGGHTSAALDVSLRVASTTEHDGLTWFHVESARGSFDAYEADGETYWLPEKEPVQPVVKWDRKSAACTFTPTKSTKARCSPSGIESMSLDSSVGVGDQIVLGVLTFGLWIPERSTCVAEVTAVP